MPDKPWEPSRRERRVLLALLSGANLHGLTIMRLSQTGSRTVYPLLARLESRGWVTEEFREKPGEKARKVYTLTRQGRKVALGFLRLED